MHHIKGGTLRKLHVIHFITLIMVNSSHVLSVYFDYVLHCNKLMPTFNRQNPSPLEDLFHETVNKTTRSVANIDNYHGDK